MFRVQGKRYALLLKSNLSGRRWYDAMFIRNDRTGYGMHDANHSAFSVIHNTFWWTAKMKADILPGKKSVFLIELPYATPRRHNPPDIPLLTTSCEDKKNKTNPLRSALFFFAGIIRLRLKSAFVVLASVGHFPAKRMYSQILFCCRFSL